MELQQLEVNDSFVRLAMRGTLDAQAVAEVEKPFLAATVARGKHAIVDISQAPFIASLGIGLFITASQGLMRKGARLVLLSPTRDVEHVFSKAGLTNMLPIAHDEEKARQMLITSV